MKLARALALIVLVSAPSVLAEGGPDPTASALFRKGRDLLEKGQWEAGCEQLRASLARYEAPSTVLNVARCEEHFGRVASAWALYQRGLVLAREEPGAQRREALLKVANQGVRATEPRLARVRVKSANAVAGLSVEEGGRPLPLDEAVPLDPGKHRIVATAPGFARFEQEVELSEGKTTEVILELEPAPASTPLSVEPSPEPRADKAKTPSSPAPPPDRSAEPVDSEPVPAWAWISGGVGLALTGVAVGFALDARAASESLENKCGGDLVCDEDPDFDPGPTNARKNRGIALAIGLGSAGVIAIGAAAIGIALRPKARAARVSPNVVATGRGLMLGAAGDF